MSICDSGPVPALLWDPVSSFVPQGHTTSTNAREPGSPRDPRQASKVERLIMRRLGILKCPSHQLSYPPDMTSLELGPSVASWKLAGLAKECSPTGCSVARRNSHRLIEHFRPSCSLATSFCPACAFCSSLLPSLDSFPLHFSSSSSRATLFPDHLPLGSLSLCASLQLSPCCTSYSCFLLDSILQGGWVSSWVCILSTRLEVGVR